MHGASVISLAVTIADERQGCLEFTLG